MLDDALEHTPCSIHCIEQQHSNPALPTHRCLSPVPRSGWIGSRFCGVILDSPKKLIFILNQLIVPFYLDNKNTADGDGSYIHGDLWMPGLCGFSYQPDYAYHLIKMQVM